MEFSSFTGKNDRKHPHRSFLVSDLPVSPTYNLGTGTGTYNLGPVYKPDPATERYKLVIQCFLLNFD